MGHYGCPEPGLSSVTFVRRNRRLSISQLLTPRLDPPLFVSSTQVSELYPGLYATTIHGETICSWLLVMHREPSDASGTSYKHGVLKTLNRDKVGPLPWMEASSGQLLRAHWLPHSPGSLGEGWCQHKPRCPYM